MGHKQDFDVRVSGFLSVCDSLFFYNLVFDFDLWA